MLRELIVLIFISIVITQSIYAQKSKDYFGWDLTYESVLERNDVDRKNWIWKWLKTDYVGFNHKYQSPAKKWISGLEHHKPIISSILIEFPAFHAAERTTMWFYRAKEKAFYREFVEVSNAKSRTRALDLEVYDKLFEQMSSWEQNEPVKLKKDAPCENWGFMGFFSFFEKDKSDQKLLTIEDFMICDPKKRNKIKRLGRLFIALKPILLSESSMK